MNPRIYCVVIVFMGSRIPEPYEALHEGGWGLKKAELSITLLLNRPSKLFQNVIT